MADKTEKNQASQTKTGLIVLSVFLVSSALGLIYWAVNTKPPLKSENVPVTNTSGKTTYSSVKDQIIEGFPQLPVYTKSKIIESYKKIEGNKIGYQAVWSTQDPLPSVAQWYLSRLPENGWAITQKPKKIGHTEMAIKVEKDGVKITLNFEEEDDDEEITLITAEVPYQEM